MIKSTVRGLLFLALGLLPSATALGATATLSFTNAAGGSSVTASPGTSFTVRVFLNASVQTIGLDFFVNQIKDALNNSPTTLFKVTARNSTGGVYDDPVPADSSTSVNSYFLNLTSPPTHGFSQISGTPAAPANTNNFVTQLTISVDPSTPNRTYTLTPTAGPASSFNGGFIDTGNGQTDFTVKTPLTVIVPEPATFGLILVGGILAGLRRPRHRA